MTGLSEQQRAHFNEVAETYRTARTHENHLALKKLIWSEFLCNKPELARPGLSVLDAMCGYGDAWTILSDYAGGAPDYRGLDYSDEVIAWMAARHPKLKVSHGDVTAYVADRQYDLVTVLGGLHHVRHAAGETVVRLAAAIRPGGWFLSLEPTHGNSLFASVRRAIYRRNALFDEETERDFSTDELRAVFENSGLELEDIMYPGLLSYVLYYNPDAFPPLNLGGAKAVRRIFAAERPLLRSPFARALSFATLSLWRKPL